MDGLVKVLSGKMGQFWRELGFVQVSGVDQRIRDCKFRGFFAVVGAPEMHPPDLTVHRHVHHPRPIPYRQLLQTQSGGNRG